jgi:putative intracellular protease/amidase
MDNSRVEIAVLLYDGVTALDAIGPYEILSRIPNSETRFVATERGVRRTDQGSLGLVADYRLDEVTQPSVVVIPGGPGQSQQMVNGQLMEWIRSVHKATQWTTSVCTGSLILAGAGILNGVRATTHWLAMDALAAYGARPIRERVVFDGKVVTGAGVSAGIDLGLQLVARMNGEQISEEIQLWIEYDPQPPFDCGSPEKAGHEIRERLRARSRFHRKGD